MVGPNPVFSGRSTRIWQESKVTPVPKILQVEQATASHRPICVGCNDTGRASNGQPCQPCLVQGRTRLVNGVLVRATGAAGK